MKKLSGLPLQLINNPKTKSKFTTIFVRIIPIVQTSFNENNNSKLRQLGSKQLFKKSFGTKRIYSTPH